MKASATVLANAALVIVYFAAAEFGLAFFALIHPSASAVWLPTGIAMSAVLLGGPRLAPAVFIGAFLANATIAGSVGTSLGVALGNTLEAVLAATLVERFAGGRDAFTSPARILRFMVLGALLSPAVSATIGVLSLTLGGATDAASSAVWFTWWLGDAAGAVLVTPLVVLWWTNRDWAREGRRSGEAVLMIAAIGVVGAATFFHPYLSQYPLAFLCLAPLVWGALRFGPREIATAIAGLAIFATAATVTGRG
jgi:integral membrane sensor domain MASE1